MLPEERRAKIVEKLHHVKVCTIKELVDEFAVSRITIMRDVAALENAGILAKIHGGTKLIQEDALPYETRFNARMNRNVDLKKAIAAEAAPLVGDDGTIFIDSSTTGYVFALELLRRPFSSLNIITNSPSLLAAVREKHRACVIVTGGELNPSFNMLGGQWVLDFLERVNIDAAFISAAGISDAGNLTTSSMDIANILRKVISRAAATTLLIDSSKLFRKEMINICQLTSCTSMITNDDISPEQAARLRDLIDLKLASGRESAGNGQDTAAT
jgi:DeoR/GlpR family transcriptional regulator of sugar metabolism